MEVHKLKAFHGWREFLKEYGIIVVGVLTALAAEQAVDWLHWRYEIGVSRQALGHEITYNIKVLKIINSWNSCIRQELDVLGAWASGTGPRPGGPVRSPFMYTLQTSTWDVANSGQVVAHFPLEMKLKYAQLFSRFENERGAISDERNSWAQIVALANQTKPDPEELRSLRAAVGVGRIWDERRRGNYVNILRQGAPMGVDGPGPDPVTGNDLWAKCETIARPTS